MPHKQLAVAGRRAARCHPERRGLSSGVPVRPGAGRGRSVVLQYRVSFSNSIQDRQSPPAEPGRPVVPGVAAVPTEPTIGRSAMGLLFATVFLDLVGFGIVIPLLPLYAERFGAGAVTVAMLLAVYSLMQFLFAPWWGQLSDRVGRRPVLLIGLFGSAGSYLIFGLAGSLAMLFIGRILAGVAGANIGVAQAYVSDITRPV